MRLIILAFITAYLAWASFSSPPVLGLSSRDTLHALVALACYLFIEGILTIKWSIRQKRHLGLPEQATTDEIEALKAETLELQEKLQQEKELSSELEQAQKSIETLQGRLRTLQEDIKKSQKAEKPQTSDRQAITLLGLFQNKGRFVDFLMQDIARYNDEKVGKVARFVHEGCSKVLKDHFAVEPIHSGSEGQKVELSNPFNPHMYKLTGKVASNPPYSGKVVHKGWKSATIKLPQPVENDDRKIDEFVIAPAEVECS